VRFIGQTGGRESSDLSELALAGAIALAFDL
jgi:hypothetical protein